MILSLSSGFQDYINDVQEQTLSSYPIEIQKQAMDYSDLLSEMTNNTDEEEDTTEHEEDKVYSGDVMGDLLVAMLSEVKDNDLESFKKYIEDESNGFQDVVSDIKYTYDTPMYIFNENAVGGTQQVNPSIMMQEMGFGDMAESQESLSGFMSAFSYGSSSMDMWAQLMDNQELLDEQYDVVAGHWPENKK